MLRKIRLTCGIICLTLITLLFLDFTGTLHSWFGWLAKIQFLPAVLALNVGVVVLFNHPDRSIRPNLLLGDLSVGGISRCSSLDWQKAEKVTLLLFSRSLPLRYGALAIFIITLVAGVSFIATLFAPYSAYGRIANNLFQPIWLWGNNLFAHLAERAGSYAFYEVDIWIKSLPTFIVAAATFVILILLAWRNGRTYCNTICR
mgnify:CR=1 FL=1